MVDIVELPRLIFPVVAGSDAATIAASHIAVNSGEIFGVGDGNYELRLTCYPGTYRAPTYFESQGILGFKQVFATTGYQVGEFGIDTPCGQAAVDILLSLNSSASGFICRNENEGSASDSHREMTVKLKSWPVAADIVLIIENYGRRSFKGFRIDFLDISTPVALAG